MIFVGAGLVPAHNGGKHKALPLRACPCPQWGQAQGIAPTKCQRFFNRYKL